MCLERAALLERHALETDDPKRRADFLTLADGWRDLAKQALANERPEKGQQPN